MAIEHRVNPDPRTEKAVAQMRRDALESKSAELRRQVRAQSLALAGKMVQLHDSACHVRIEDDFSFVMVVRDFNGMD